MHKINCPSCTHGCSLGVAIIRISTGVTILLSAIFKLTSPEMFQSFVHSIDALGNMQSFIIMTYPWVELILGAALILGICSRYIAGITAFAFLLISIYVGFMQNNTLALHAYIFLISLGLTCMPSGCIGLEYLWKKKKEKNIERIKV